MAEKGFDDSEGLFDLIFSDESDEQPVLSVKENLVSQPGRNVGAGEDNGRGPEDSGVRGDVRPEESTNDSEPGRALRSDVRGIRDAEVGSDSGTGTGWYTSDGPGTSESVAADGQEPSKPEAGRGSGVAGSRAGSVPTGSRRDGDPVGGLTPGNGVDSVTSAEVSVTGQKEGPVTDTSHVQEEADSGDGQEVTGPVFRMDMSEEYVPSGPKARFQANVAAIERVRSLTETGRTATGQDQEVLAGWSSWGAVADVFDETKSNWAAEREQLRELLTEYEWEAARATTINAHYTAPAIVGEMWSALQKLGLNEGKVLEPGCGSGNFIGTAPDSMDMVGIELDPISAQVAGYLYPNAEVRNESFGKTLVRPDQFDATIANVPFGNFSVFDPSWNPGERFSIHNYFIRKAVGGLHEGGIGVMMTSAFTMDSQNPAFRAEISREADLLGAVRLPNGTHRRTAGTEVVTDVLVFRKRMEGEEPTPETLRWVKSTPTQIGNAGGRLLLNRYFQDHPENVLGELEISTYRDTQIDVKTDNLAAVPEQLRDRLAAIVDAADERGRTYVAPSPEVLAAREQSVAMDLNPGQWPGTLMEREPESFVRVIDGETVEVKVPKNAMDEVRSLMDLRDRASALIEGQVATPVDTEELVALREETREVWAKHVERFGPINRHRTRWQTKIVRNDDTGEKERVRVQVRVDPTPAKIMRDDPLWSLTKALEIYNDETEEAVAADVLHQRTVEQNRPLLGADTAEEALGLCLDARGRAELDRIANLLGTDEDTARAELGALVFDDPETGRLATRAEYLSGNVRTKLEAAERAAEGDDRYKVNVQELQKVIPESIGLEDITPTIGAVWIPAEDHERFLRDIAQDRLAKVHKAGAGFWEVEHGGSRRTVEAASQWGTERMPVYDIYRKLLSGAEITVMDTLEDKTRVLNATETEAARAKADEIVERFEDWVWEDPERSERLVTEYNRRFNSLVPRDYEPEAERLKLPGLVDDYVPHPHQKTAVARIIAEPAVGLFHVVGAGKTGAAVVGMMELKRRGLVSKPAVLVPGHMLEQFTREWQEMYPNAKLLSAGSDDVAAKGGNLNARRAFIAKATTGEWDGIIMTHSAFRLLGVKPDTAKNYFRDITAELDEARVAMEEATGRDNNRTVKNIEKAKKTQEARLEKILAKADETNLSFEDTGIDYLTVDEAHEYKNLHTPTSIAGAFIEGSQKATDLEMKIGYLRDTYGERVVTLATGTPIANSISEAHVMSKLLRPDLLEDAGVKSFDQWGSTFGETVTRIERDAAGRLKQRTRFAKFKNVPEMLSSWQQFADVRRSEDLNLPVPDQAVNSDGERRPEMVIIPRTETHAKYMEYLEERLDRLSGRPEKGADNHLTVYNDGRKVALDPRMVGEEFSGDVKINYVTRRVASIWRENRDNEYLVPGTAEVSENRGAFQIVFCDLSTPNDDEWNAYDQMKSDLVTRHGMERDRIRFIHDAKDDEQRAELFKAAREGRVDVLIGSSQKMGTGANIQTRAIAMHHVDCPWRPDQLEQREGRILRQGNQNDEVQIYRYATENTFDSTSWDIIGRKATAISQVMRGRLDVRELDDPGDLALDAQQMMAGSSGNPLLVERTELDVTVQKLSRRARGHDKAQAALKYRRSSAEQRLEQVGKRLPDVEAAIARRIDTRGDAFQATVAGRRYEDRKDTSEAILGLIRATSRPGGGMINGEGNRIEMGGFIVDMSFDFNERMERKVLLTPADTGAHPDSVQVELDYEAVLDERSGVGGNVAQLIENKISGLDRVQERLLKNREEAESILESVDGQLGKPFKHAEELEDAQSRLAEIDRKIKQMQEEEDRKKQRETSDRPARESLEVGGENSERDSEYAAANYPNEHAGVEAEAQAKSEQALTQLVSELGTLNERVKDPMERASATDGFWNGTRKVEELLDEARQRFVVASQLQDNSDQARRAVEAARARESAVEMIREAREARVASFNVLQRYVDERLPGHGQAIVGSDAFRRADQASIERMVQAVRYLPAVDTESTKRLQSAVEDYQGAVERFTAGNAEANERLGKNMRGAALGEEIYSRLDATEKKLITARWKSMREALSELPQESAVKVEACLRGGETNEVVEKWRTESPRAAFGLADVEGLRQGIPSMPPHGLNPHEKGVTTEMMVNAQRNDRKSATLRTDIVGQGTMTAPDAPGPGTPGLD